MSEGVVIASDNSDAKVKKKSYSDWKQIRAIFAGTSYLHIEIMYLCTYIMYS